MESIADVKCYYCGHISGQVRGTRGAAIKVSAFVPRSGYTKEMPKAGERLRCERCAGPVYLEDVSPVTFDKPLSVLGQGQKRARPKSKAA